MCIVERHLVKAQFPVNIGTEDEPKIEWRDASWMSSRLEPCARE